MFGPVLYDVVDMAGIIDGDEQTPSGGKESKKKNQSEVRQIRPRKKCLFPV